MMAINIIGTKTSPEGDHMSIKLNEMKLSKVRGQLSVLGLQIMRVARHRFRGTKAAETENPSVPYLSAHRYHNKLAVIERAAEKEAARFL